MSTEHHHHLADIAAELDVPHFLPRDLAALVGDPEEFRAAARVWREAAETVEQSSGAVDGELGGIDTAWQGADAEAFVSHIRGAGLAGKDLVDSMTALADALEHAAEGIGAQRRRLNELVAKTADDVKAAVVAADPARARKCLADLDEPARELLESIADYYMAFTRLCDDMAGIPTREPGRWEPRTSGSEGTPVTPAAPASAEGGASSGASAGSGVAAADSGDPAASGGAAATEPAAATTAAGAPAESEEGESGAGAAGGVAAGAAVGAAGVGMGMMPMGMMGGMLGQQRGAGNQERQNSSRFKSNPEDLFGAPPDAPPAVFGDQAKPEQAQPEGKPAQTAPESQAAQQRLNLPSTLQPAPAKPSIDEVLTPSAPHTSDPARPPTSKATPASTANPTAKANPATPEKPTPGGSAGSDEKRTKTPPDSQANPAAEPEKGTAGVGDAPPPKRRG